MNRMTSGPCLSAVFVDYDNIYLSLKRKNEDAARRFAKDTLSWLKQIETGALITPTNQGAETLERRIVLSRCYGNPVPRRNNRDNGTDMQSFPFVRHHFLRSGFEVIDCPPLTAQLKNSSDIRMVMDIRDLLEHDTRFDEFIILSGDADFTPMLHRLRSHARSTVIFANDYTAAPYTAICDGEIREIDLINLLMDDVHSEPQKVEVVEELSAFETNKKHEQVSSEISDEVITAIRESGKPVPIAYLADRAQRALGHEKTAGTNWAGFGTFRTFLVETLPKEFCLTDSPPYYAFDPSRHALPQSTASQPEALEAPKLPAEPPALPKQSVPAAPSVPPQQSSQLTTHDLQDSIARIHEACKVPPLAPPDYQLLFELMAQELNENGLRGGQTITNTVSRSIQNGMKIKREDVQFVLDVVSEADPWFEQGASKILFASRFRNYVVFRCREAGVKLSMDELDLIDAWFVGAPTSTGQPNVDTHPAGNSSEAMLGMEGNQDTSALATSVEQEHQRWWGLPREQHMEQQAATQPAEVARIAPPHLEPMERAQPQLDDNDYNQLPRIVRSRMRG